MCEVNQTEVKEFVLLGFQGLYQFKFLLFFVFLMSYLVILIGNLAIIVVISTNERLQIPMFIFLQHLAIADLQLANTIVPLMLDIILKNTITISFNACFIQLFGFCIFGTVQCFLIVIMSYDRYLAICKPMHYNSIMGPHICLRLVAGCWLLVFCVPSEMSLMFQLRYCGENRLDHFFCEAGPLVQMSTSDTSNFLLVDFVLSILEYFIPFAFVIVMYMLIVFAILKISSTSGKQKAFSTCSSHLATVCAYYGTLMTVYMATSDESTLDTIKFKSLLYIIVTPMMNPIIYSLRNHEIQKTLQQILKNIKLLQ